MLFGWVSDGPPAPRADVLASMGRALRVTAAQRVDLWSDAPVAVGVIRSGLARGAPTEPARGADGSLLWMSGEAFEGPARLRLAGASDSWTLSFRQRLLQALDDVGVDVIRDLDGEYQIAWWRASSRTLTLINDRFGACPLYVGRGKAGMAFGGGVRGVLMAPGVDASPDADAIRESVTFGGFRLGSRTNVRGVQMLPPAVCATLSTTTVATRRYWTWAELPTESRRDRESLLEETRETWRDVVRQRLDGSTHPGLTLSGGLDSRAVLAEMVRHAHETTALTYGVSRCDDVRIARRVASAAGVRWVHHRLYDDGWLQRRVDRVMETDGLMELADLMHTEAIPGVPELFDAYLSGYVGDAVTGATFLPITDAESLMRSMPYYGGLLGMPHGHALECITGALGQMAGAPCHAPYELKLPQAISRITAAARPYVTVRRPFVAYRFFELAQRVPAAWKASHRWHHDWLRSTYPALFASIPHQRTGVPAGASRARWHATRAVRFAWRKGLSCAGRFGLPVRPLERTFHPDERFWSTPEVRQTIESTVLRPDSVSAEVFGRHAVRTLLSEFFERGAAPVQVVGALFVFERYHQQLPSSLIEARAHTGAHAC